MERWNGELGTEEITASGGRTFAVGDRVTARAPNRGLHVGDTGEVVNDAVATHNVRGELVRLDGAWKVSSTRLVQRWEGVAGCALDP